MSFITDFIGLIYPALCAGCGNPLWKNESIVCTFCEYHLPKTNFHLEQDNLLIRFFWGRAEIEYASAFLYFNKGNTVQHLVHALKYKGRKDIGIWFGKRFGDLLKTAPGYDSFDLIIPVPLHQKKLILRGFNQSEQFAMGLSFSLGIPVETGVLFRHKSSETQTRKSRFFRWQNVEGIFSVVENSGLEHKHILLVDDVITTGATIEACMKVLEKIPGIRISVAAIAVATV